MTPTVALHGRIYDLVTVERQQEAKAWITANLGDTSQFEEEFPDAHALAQVLRTHGMGMPLRFYVSPSAADFGNGWEPEVRVVFARADGSIGVALRHFSNLGSFPSFLLACEAAGKVEVVDIRADDSVVFAHEQR